MFCTNFNKQKKKTIIVENKRKTCKNQSISSNFFSFFHLQFWPNKKICDRPIRNHLCAIKPKGFSIFLNFQNSELLTLTYGALVTQMLRDFENLEEVNKQLDRVGYNMGVRLIEDFLSRTNSGRCFDLRDTSDKIQQAFKMYLNVQPTISNWAAATDEFSLIFDVNPLTEFVELPADLSNLRYCGILCGCIRGALEMVQLEVQCQFVQVSEWKFVKRKKFDFNGGSLFIGSIERRCIYGNSCEIYSTSARCHSGWWRLNKHFASKICGTKPHTSLRLNSNSRKTNKTQLLSKLCN